MSTKVTLENDFEEGSWSVVVNGAAIGIILRGIRGWKFVHFRQYEFSHSPELLSEITTVAQEKAFLLNLTDRMMA